MKNYEEIFELRGSRYDKAMREHPNARDQEFEQIISRASLKGKETVADVPAGGGYLKDYLSDDYFWLGHEPCSSFSSHSSPSDKNNALIPLPWENNTVDVVFSLAGVHHLDNKRPLFSEIFRVLKHKGRFLLSDVGEHSTVARFLDDYVGKYNSTGHSGIFLNDSTLTELSDTGWKISSIEYVDFYWKFVDLVEMEVFCNNLFDIKTTEAGQTVKAIKQYLGVKELPDGYAGMNWSLKTIVAQKN